MAPSNDPPEFLRLWEDLHVAIQAAVLGLVSVLLLWAAHVGPMNQPPLRGLSYAIFWGAVVSGILLAATRSERARRRPKIGPR